MDRCGNAADKCHGQERRKEAKIGEFMYRHTMKVGHEMHSYISSN